MVGSLPLEEQKLWFPNQLDHDPDSWTTPHFLNLKTGYDILVNKYTTQIRLDLNPWITMGNERVGSKG
jgi:hypothetical protein